MTRASQISASDAASGASSPPRGAIDVRIRLEGEVSGIGRSTVTGQPNHQRRCRRRPTDWALMIVTAGSAVTAHNASQTAT